MTKQDTNVCKGVGILFLLFHHVFFHVDAVNAYAVSFAPFSVEQGVKLAYAFKFCVTMFVFLTAYGTAMQYRARSIETPLQAVQYAASRVIKLLTGFWVVYAAAQSFAFLGLNTLAVYGQRGTPRVFYLLLDLFGLADFWGSPSLNVTWWYLSFALLLICMLPAILFLANRVGVLILPMALFLMSSLAGNLGAQLPAVALGVVFVQYDVLPRLRAGMRKTVVHRIVCAAALGWAWVWLLQNKAALGQEAIVECLLATLSCTMAYLYLAPVPVVRQTLAFLGRHSMNMFLLHSFFYLYFCTAWVYRWQHAVPVYAALVALSLAASCVLELLKKLVHFHAAVAWLIEKNNALLARAARTTHAAV